jgi:hypothetical protein
MIFFLLRLGIRLLTTGTGFNLEGGVWNRGGGDESAPATVVGLGWWLGFSFEANWYEDA